jgi:hypothetical protein
MERTKHKSRLTAVRNIIERQGTKQGPSVDAVDPEVRTDLWLPVTPGKAKDLDERIKTGDALGAYVVEWGFDVPEPKWDEFHRWLDKNERKLARSAPAGVRYKGTVVAVFGPLHRPDGRYRTFWALTSTEDVQNFWMKSGKDFRALLKDFLGFHDRTSRSGFSQLYQVAASKPVY